jgi:DNA polymerase-3 subunit delta
MLVGDDEAGKTAVAAEFLSLMDEGLQAFNVDRFHGHETRVDQVIQAAATLPMMAVRRVVLVFQAERLLMPRRESKATESELERLEGFLKAPVAHSSVVFVCGKLDQRRRVVRLLVREAQVIDCGTIHDEAGAARWVKAKAEDGGVRLESTAIRALVERTGPNARLLRSALERLMLYAHGQTSITVDDVKQAVSFGPEAQTDFGIAKAIWRGDVASALHELHVALEAGIIPVMVLGQLRVAAEKGHTLQVPAAIDAVFRADLALKSSGGEPRVLLERLVLELCPKARVGSKQTARRKDR